MDAYSNKPYFRALFEKINASHQRIATFGELSKCILSGITPKAKGDAYVDPPQGVRFIRSGEITEDGGVLPESEVHISESIHSGLMRRSQIQKGDLLIAIVGATIGASGVYEYDAPANINQAIAAVRFRDPHVLLDYARWYLHSSLGQAILDYLKRPVARANINLEEIAEIPLVIPSPDRQRVLASEMERARESRRHKLAEADALLAGLDAFLLDRIGLTVPDSDNRLTYAMRLSTVLGSKQIGADYFHPERMNTLRAIQKARKVKHAARLDAVADFLREIVTEYEPEQYLGLAGVQSQTGELAETTEEPGKGHAFLYKENDVLFARLRPYLNKVWRAERDGVCSTEFHVIRIKEGMHDLLPDYLAAVLRSFVIVAQTKHMMTGNTHPRLANEDVVDLLIPIPDLKTQQEIVGELRSRRVEARRLREDVAREWEAAKARFEARLLGGEGAR